MIGETLGGYRITRKLGEGGMGVVYEAEHIFLGRRAAIKALLPELSSNAEAVGRFFIEAKTAAMLNHPGLVDIYDQGHTEGPNSRVFIIMEFLEGEDLGTVLRREGKVPLKRAMQVARQVASALAAVHQKGIVHRDLKPDNLFLVPVPGSTSGQFRMKVLDFGIAKLTGPENKDLSVKTRTGSVLGTPSYMSPEQCRGHGKIDWRSDIYSLGCIIQEMITGHPPFTGSGYGEVLAQHIYEQPPPLRSLDPTVPPAVEALVLKTLVKAPDQRMQTMDELASAIDAMFSTPSMISMQGVGGPPAAFESGGMFNDGSGMSLLPVAPGTPQPQPGPTSNPMAATLPPQEMKRDTTMRKAASEVIRAERGQKKKSVVLPLVMALGAAAVIGVVAFVAVGSGGSTPTAAATPTTQPPEAPPPADPPPKPLEPEATPPKPEPVAVEAPSTVKEAEPPKPEPPKPEPPKPEPPKPEPPKPEPVAVTPPKPEPVAVTPPKPEPPKPEPPKPEPPKPEPPKPVVVAPPAKVPVKITSEPAGAEVFAASGARVGKTPFETQLVPGTGKLAYVLKLKGYKDGRAEIPADKGGGAQVKLVAEPAVVAAPPPPVKPEPPKPLVTKPTGGKKPKPVKDGVVNPFK